MVVIECTKKRFFGGGGGTFIRATDAELVTTVCGAGTPGLVITTEYF